MILFYCPCKVQDGVHKSCQPIADKFSEVNPYSRYAQEVLTLQSITITDEYEKHGESPTTSNWCRNRCHI